MRGRIFFDSNIIIYVYSKDEHEKKLIAENLLLKNNCFVSTQVLQEISNVLRKKYKTEWKKIKEAIVEIENVATIKVNHQETIKEALSIAEKTKYSFYDSLIIASALEAECTILYSEDMQHNQLIEKKLRIINPFL